MTYHPLVIGKNSVRPDNRRVFASLCLVALCAVNVGLCDRATAVDGGEATTSVGVSDVSAQRPLLHGYYHLEGGAITRRPLAEGPQSAADVTQHLRNIRPSGLPMSPDSLALFDHRSDILYLYSGQQAHADFSRFLKADNLGEPAVSMVMEVRAYKLDPTTDPRPPTRRLIDALRDGIEPGTRLFSTEQTVRSASRMSVEFGVHPRDHDEVGTGDPSNWVRFDADPFGLPTASPESVRVNFYLSTLAPSNGDSERGEHLIEVTVGGELAGSTREWLVSRHRTSDIEVLLMIRLRIHE